MQISLTKIGAVVREHDMIWLELKASTLVEVADIVDLDDALTSLNCLSMLNEKDQSIRICLHAIPKLQMENNHS